MRILLVGLILVSLNCITLAQDPTLPSQEILQRLNGNSSTAISIAPRQPIKFYLKAIVLSDKNHGTALIEVDGRSVRVLLDRSSIRLTRDVTDNKLASLGNSSSNGLEVEGAFFIVEDFNSNSITLFDGMRRVHVQ